MKRLAYAVVLTLSLGCVLANCGGNKQGKNDAPAGSPDELKDSTRLDAAPDTAQPQNPK